ncbi:MAG: MobA [Devosia sp.]|nr:MobA [Devosia sp.]
MPEPAILILAGGLGTRLGGRLKAAIPIGGVRLLDRLAVVFARCSPILVATGHHPLERFGLTDTMIAVPDASISTVGPVAGLSAGLEWLQLHRPQTELLVSVAVDTPFFPSDFTERALPLLGRGIDVVVGAYGGQDYPTNAMWRLAALRDLPARCAADAAPRGLKGLIGEIGAVRLDYREISGVDPFVNLNTPVDLDSLEGRAAGMMGLPRRG